MVEDVREMVDWLRIVGIVENGGEYGRKLVEIG